MSWLPGNGVCIVVVLTRNRRVTAAAHSMHQFCQTIRNMVRSDLDDAAVEAVTMFLYVRIAREVFGQRFVKSMWTQLKGLLKYSSATDAKARVEGIARRLCEYEHSVVGDLIPGAATAYQHHVRCTLRAILAECNLAANDAELLQTLFMPFVDAMNRIQAHLEGIKGQNHFLLR